MCCITGAYRDLLLGNLPPPPPCLQLKEFYASHTAYPKVVAHMKKNWAELAVRWAWFGRVAILDMEANTNNLVERFFGLLKYQFLDRNTQCTMQQLVDVLLREVVACFMQMRAQHLVGRVTSGQQQQVQRLERWVEQLVSSGAVAAPKDGDCIRLTSVAHGDGSVLVCLGDLSCGCSYTGELSCEELACRHVVAPCCKHAGEGGTVLSQNPPPQPPPAIPTPTPTCNAGGSTCVHIKAAGRVIGFTPTLRGAAAAYLLAKDLIQVDANSGICTCTSLADNGKKVYFRPKESFCTCHDRTLHGTCCHLQAAPLLTAFLGLELPGEAVHIVAGNGGTVSTAQTGACSVQRGGEGRASAVVACIISHAPTPYQHPTPRPQPPLCCSASTSAGSVGFRRPAASPLAATGARQSWAASWGCAPPMQQQFGRCRATQIRQWRSCGNALPALSASPSTCLRARSGRSCGKMWKTCAARRRASASAPSCH